MNRSAGPYARALAFVRRHQLLRPGERVLVGVGRGASLGLLGFLTLAREDLDLAEIVGAAVESTTDEGSDAAEEVADAGRLVRQYGLTFHGLRPAGAPSTRVEVVRELVALAKDQGFQRVALGHTRDDDALTVLGQIASGKGLAGITGLAPRRRDGVVRPLLALSYGEACSLARETYPMLPPNPMDSRRTLATELTTQVMPRLHALVPRIDEALARVGREARKLRRSTRSEAIRRLEMARQPDGSLDLPLLPEGGELAWALAEAALQTVAARPLRDEDVGCLARILTRGNRTRGATLLAGVVVTLVPERAVVHLKVMIPTLNRRGAVRPRPDG